MLTESAYLAVCSDVPHVDTAEALQSRPELGTVKGRAASLIARMVAAALKPSSLDADQPVEVLPRILVCRRTGWENWLLAVNTAVLGSA